MLDSLVSSRQVCKAPEPSKSKAKYNLSLPVLLAPFDLSSIVKHALTAIIISHLSHLLSVLVLFQLTMLIIPTGDHSRRRIAFKAACLHILSPAGLFLSAPYAESTFALFNFLGMMCYARSLKPQGKRTSAIGRSAWTVAAGASFGIATTMRSNGLLSGIVFAWDTLEDALELPTVLQHRERLVHVIATLVAGICVALGFIIPQAVAYKEYCTDGNTRPWCSRLPPSIYSWVQDHYWEVGFLRYWTLNNLPLFLLAAPMLAVMFYTGYSALLKTNTLLRPLAQQDDSEVVIEQQSASKRLLQRFALPQLVLTVMAATSFHVQIITRISSGYPVWYIVLAMAIEDATVANPGSRRARSNASIASQGVSKTTARSNQILSSKQVQYVVRGLVMYAVIQGGLYASFLPPA